MHLQGLWVKAEEEDGLFLRYMDIFLLDYVPLNLRRKQTPFMVSVLKTS
jgi:hypothetical protein